MPEPVRSALVTGSCGGLGFAVAESLAAIGCNIMLHGLEDDDNAEPVSADLAGRSGVKVAYHRADLTDLYAVDRLMQAGHETFGGPDIVVKNAVVSPYEIGRAWRRARGWAGRVEDGGSRGSKKTK